MKVKDWLDTIERNTPKGLPQLACGWPDEEHGITWDGYIEHLITMLEGMNEGDPLPTLTFQAWKNMRREEDEDRDLLGFCWEECDLCGALAGNRYAVTALPDNPAENHDYVALSVCKDCLYYTASGDVPERLEGEDT